MFAFPLLVDLMSLLLYSSLHVCLDQLPTLLIFTIV